MRHIAVNFYESFHSTDWAEREYHYLSTDDDLEYGEILAVYTRHGISIARFRRYLDESNSHAESYVAKRLNIKVTGETTSLIENTQRDILLDNLARLVQRKETIRLAETYAENDEDISNLLKAYKDVGNEPEEDEETIAQEEPSDELNLSFNGEDFSDPRFNGISIHEGEKHYRYVNENEATSVFYVNTDENFMHLKEELIGRTATPLGSARNDDLSQMTSREAFVVYKELLSVGARFFNVLSLDSFKEQEYELKAIPFHYTKDKSFNEQDVVKDLARLNIKYEINDSLMASIVSEHLTDREAVFLASSAQEIKDHDYNESGLIVYATVQNQTQQENDLLTSCVFVRIKTINKDEEEEIDEMITNISPPVDSAPTTWIPLAINAQLTQIDLDSVDLSDSETRPITDTDMEELKYVNFISLHEDLLDTTSPKGTIINIIDYSDEHLTRKAYIHVDSQEEMIELLQDITNTELTIHSEVSISDDVLLLENSTHFNELKLTSMSLDDVPDEYEFAVFEETSRLKGSDFDLSKVTPFINHSSYGLFVPIELRSLEQQNRMISALKLKGYSWIDGTEMAVEEYSLFEGYALCIYLTEKYVTKVSISDFDEFVPKPIHQID